MVRTYGHLRTVAQLLLFAFVSENDRNAPRAGSESTREEL